MASVDIPIFAPLERTDFLLKDKQFTSLINMEHHAVMRENWRTVRFRLTPTQPPLWSHKSRSIRTKACGFQCKGHAARPENQQNRSYKDRLWLWPNSFALSLDLIKRYKPWFAATLGIWASVLSLDLCTLNPGFIKTPSCTCCATDHRNFAEDNGCLQCLCKKFSW